MGVEHTAALSGSELSPSPSDNIRESWGWTRGMEGRNRREGIKGSEGRERRERWKRGKGREGWKWGGTVGGMEGMQNNAADSPWLSWFRLLAFKVTYKVTKLLIIILWSTSHQPRTRMHRFNYPIFRLRSFLVYTRDRVQNLKIGIHAYSSQDSKNLKIANLHET